MWPQDMAQRRIVPINAPEAKILFIVWPPLPPKAKGLKVKNQDATPQALLDQRVSLPIINERQMKGRRIP